MVFYYIITIVILLTIHLDCYQMFSTLSFHLGILEIVRLHIRTFIEMLLKFATNG